MLDLLFKVISSPTVRTSLLVSFTRSSPKLSNSNPSRNIGETIKKTLKLKMGFLGLLQFALKHFHVLAWPLFSLVYPLCSSIRAIEANSISDTQKLNTYWVVYSLVLLFEHTCMKLLEWLLLWPYIRLMVFVWLVIPRFDGAFYVYKHLICPCLSMDPQIVANWVNKKDSLFVRQNFLAEVERYVKDNGPEALENIVACKSETTKSNLDMKYFRAVSSTENKESKSRTTIVAQKDIKAVQVGQAEPNLTETENFRFGTMEIKEKAIEVAADREILKTPPSKKVQKDLKAVQVGQAEPNLTETENFRFGTMEIKEKAIEVAADREILNTPPSKKVQKGFKAVQVGQAEPNLAETKNFRFGPMEIKEKAIEVAADREILKTPPSKKVQKEWKCAINPITIQSDTTFDSHLDGKKHKAAYEAPEIKNQTEPKLNQIENSKFAAVETKEKAVEVATGSEVLESSKNVQKEWTCALCQIATSCETNLNMHLEGRKHKAAYEALKPKNPVSVPKIAPDSTAKKSDQRNEEPGKCTSSSGSKVKVIIHDKMQGQKNSIPGSITKNSDKSKVKPAEGVSSDGLKRNIDINFKGKVQGQQQNPNEVPRMKNSPRRCIVCDVCCPGEIDMASHLKGRRHKEKVQEVIRKNDPLGINPLWCKICKVSCTSEFDMASHLSGRKHLDNPLWCKICNVTCSSEFDMASHLNGRKHMDNLSAGV